MPNIEWIMLLRMEIGLRRKSLGSGRGQRGEIQGSGWRKNSTNSTPNQQLGAAVEELLGLIPDRHLYFQGGRSPSGGSGGKNSPPSSHSFWKIAKEK